MEKQFKIGPFGPSFHARGWNIGFTLSMFFNWPWQNHHRDKTYRYIGARLLCPFYLKGGRVKLNSFRIGKHVDHCGRLYIYLAWIILLQDVYANHCKDLNASSAKTFVWN